MMGHKICFDGELCIIIPKLSLLLLLIWSTDSYNAKKKKKRKILTKGRYVSCIKQRNIKNACRLKGGREKDISYILVSFIIMTGRIYPGCD